MRASLAAAAAGAAASSDASSWRHPPISPLLYRQRRRPILYSQSQLQHCASVPAACVTVRREFFSSKVRPCSLCRTYLRNSCGLYAYALTAANTYRTLYTGSSRSLPSPWRATEVSEWEPVTGKIFSGHFVGHMFKYAFFSFPMPNQCFDAVGWAAGRASGL